MNAGRPTHVVLLTSPARGAIASVLVTGPDTVARVAELFRSVSHRHMDQQPCGAILFGRWESATIGEEVVVCRRDACQVEIHCHGGRAAATAIIESLVVAGCQRLEWRDWTRANQPDPLLAAARIALAEAPTERTAVILWDQHAGALRRAIDAIDQYYRAGDARQALARVDELLAFAPLGRHLCQPWKIVLAGQPNVGKSSLINALVGYERVIVHATPGTTRDVVAVDAAFEGWPVELVDTAGLHVSSDPVETAGMRLARERLAAADLVVLVFDASTPWSAADRSLVEQWPAALEVASKCDRLAVPRPAATTSARIPTSATTGQGLEDLQRALVARLVPRIPAAGQAVPFAVEQIEVLEQLREALAASCHEATERLLTRLSPAVGC